ncbi:MAG TPA: hypothetical protein VJR47_11960 [Stellaceae bacterium]|nr:hypothetical protein [Stellaceae bacterium]
MAQRNPVSLPGVFIMGLTAASLAVFSARAAEDAAKEVTTAATHAGLAAAAKDMKDVQMHLHHTVNCLVGPAGAGFDTKEANPCKDQGNGAIPDTKDPGKLAALRDALTQVNNGLKQTDMAAAQKDASAAQGLIKKAM